MYKLILSPEVIKQLKKLDKSVSRKIINWLEKNVENSEDPRHHAKPLQHDFKGLWRYRIGNYRVIVEIEDDKLIVVALDAGHRSTIYKMKRK